MTIPENPTIIDLELYLDWVEKAADDSFEIGLYQKAYYFKKRGVWAKKEIDCLKCKIK